MRYLTCRYEIVLELTHDKPAPTDKPLPLVLVHTLGLKRAALININLHATLAGPILHLSPDRSRSCAV